MKSYKKWFNSIPDRLKSQMKDFVHQYVTYAHKFKNDKKAFALEKKSHTRLYSTLERCFGISITGTGMSVLDDRATMEVVLLVDEGLVYMQKIKPEDLGRL